MSDAGCGQEAYVAELTHTLTECAQKIRQRAGELIQEADPCDPVLLRPGGERRGEHTDCHRDEEASPVHYWITSSARSSSDAGIVRPRAFAVFRLITRSYFVGCSTGRSVGLGS
jgi:hypothetical protein